MNSALCCAVRKPGSSDCPEKGNRRLPANLTPPDYISIPEYLRATPVGGPGLSERLRNLLRYAGIRLLGDLDGKRLSNFEPYRGCGQGTLWELRCMIFKALHPGVKPDLSTRPIPMRYWRPSKPTIEVVRAAEDLRPKDLPVSVRLEGVLQGLGIERLGQLHGLPVHKLLVRPNCGRKTIAELRTLLLRAEAGEFALSRRRLLRARPQTCFATLTTSSADCRSKSAHSCYSVLEVLDMSRKPSARSASNMG